MITEKETLLQQYLELTAKMLEAMVRGQEDDLLPLLEQRQQSISTIDKLDIEAGKILTNQRIQGLLSEVMSIEKIIGPKLQQSLKKLSNQVRFAKNEQYLTKQYEDLIPVSKGVFYDQKK